MKMLLSKLQLKLVELCKRQSGIEAVQTQVAKDTFIPVVTIYSASDISGFRSVFDHVQVCANPKLILNFVLHLSINSKSMQRSNNAFLGLLIKVNNSCANDQ